MAASKTIAELLVKIGVDGKDAAKASKKVADNLHKVKKSGEGASVGIKKAQKALGSLNKEFQLVQKTANFAKAAILGVTGIVAGLGKVAIGAGATFEKLRAQLKTATGSAEGAEKALGFVRDFAKNTPFQVAEITEAFVKLTNLGLEPSARALTSYGDTASAMGKSLDQFIEAAADASTGEFERLKEFGIKSKSEGDRVAFTFRGITTEVGKNSKEINEFLIGLGENNFAGAMAEQMGTLGGLTSNLKDAFTDFLLAVAESGPLEEFKKLITDLRDASGDKDGLAKTLGRVLVSAIRAVRRLIQGDLIKTLKTAAEALSFVVDNFDKLIFLFGAAKTFQAFQAISTGFQAMGIASAGALGPIGAISAALIAIIPIAMEAGRAIGGALSKGRQGSGTGAPKGAPGTLGEEFGEGTLEAAQAGSLQDEIQREASLQDRLAGEGRGDSQSAKQSRERMRKANVQLDKVRRTAATKKKAQQERAAEVASADAAEGEEFGTFDADVASVRKALGIGDGPVSAKKQAKLDKAFEALAEGKSLQEARKAAGLDRTGGGRGKKAPEAEAPKVTSPTSLSEFFGAAGRGELGPIAARTPSTKDIEPTVAIDITNNNFKFDVKQTITGTTSAADTAKEVAKAIRVEFQSRLSSAGQQLATNVVR